MNPDQEYRKFLRSANASVQETLGRVKAEWELEEGGRGGSKTLTFGGAGRVSVRGDHRTSSTVRHRCFFFPTRANCSVENPSYGGSNER